MEDTELQQVMGESGLQIAIDGPAGAGKSTVGQALARALGCSYLDTGLMYRAVTWLALSKNVSLSDGPALARLARSIKFALECEAPGRLHVNDEPAPEALRAPQVDAAVSDVSAQREVRQVLVARQRELAEGRCVVVVGRDIGTTVLPEATVKLWVTATPEERARRRLLEQGGEVTARSRAEMISRIEARDKHDMTRAVSPFRKPKDAIVVETDRMTPEEAVAASVSAVLGEVERLQAART